MYNSGVRILPDTSQFDQAINRMGQVNAGLLQQEYEDKKQQIDEFKAIIDKSFHPVYGKDRDEYLKIQEQFLSETAKRYKDRQGRLTAKDYTEVNNGLRNVEEYVALYKGAKDAMTKAVFDVYSSKDDRVDKQKSLQALKDISNLSLKDRYEALNNGSWLSIKQKPFDAAKHVKDNFAPAYATNFEQRSGKAGTIVNVNTTSFNKEKLNEIAISNWNGNIDDVRDHFSSYNDYLADVKSRMKLETEKGSATRIGGTSGSGNSKNKTVEITPTRPYNNNSVISWEVESDGKAAKLTVQEHMDVYDSKGQKVNLKNTNTFDGDVIRYEKRNIGNGDQMYAVVKSAVGLDVNQIVLGAPESVEGKKDVRKNKDVYYVPMSQLPKTWLNDKGIILKDFEDEDASQSNDPFSSIDVSGLSGDSKPVKSSVVSPSQEVTPVTTTKSPTQSATTTKAVTSAGSTNTQRRDTIPATSGQSLWATTIKSPTQSATTTKAATNANTDPYVEADKVAAKYDKPGWYTGGGGAINSADMEIYLSADKKGIKPPFNAITNHLEKNAPLPTKLNEKNQWVYPDGKIYIEDDLIQSGVNLESKTAQTFVKKFRDYEYKMGAKGKDKKIDCSGAVCEVLKDVVGDAKLNDTTLNNSAAHLYDRSVKAENVKDGDLILFNTSGDKWDHVGFLVWNNDQWYIAEISETYDRPTILPFSKRLGELELKNPKLKYDIRRYKG